ncbi:fimbria/pilus outer membrane usher protein [Atlantibacter subterranea]|uniref:Fimbria/pilus outer membrane usher protein n=1 Tax=Atlantibacter subterraneus TaxID=255519 RepID=A0ABU4DYC5_9ENTR|nr:fimbria/pilus outer membrane usher protein [Atlantibacter subterranea]MDV7021136.1 fimbria/pilus outer membrane usher protein [Atlantibacter subterranea]MDZ5664766.1 fimbria/pilus outer membrane usher protein [Atlantibacter hermannii]
MRASLHGRLYPVSRLAFCITLALSGPVPSLQARDFFNPELLEIDNPAMKGADLSAFESGAQAPGTYHVDVIINDQTVDTRDIAFHLVRAGADDEKLQPCLSVGLLQSWGVKTGLFPGLGSDPACANLADIPSASAEFLFNTQKLALSIPQAAMSPQARGYVDPSQWNDGIPALMLNYSVSGSNNRSKHGGQNSDSQYANLRPGLNLGAWRLRNYTTWNRDSSGQDKWDTVYTYLQRSIVSLKSQLTVGDSTSPADVFDSIPWRGAQLASDDEMLPDSLKGYAPVVRGVARTSAQVVIRQNGYVIYQSYVAPGAFEITDMYPTGGAGDLNVTVKEADGSEQHFTVPYASLPVLQREGRLKYAVSGGQYRSYDSRVDKTPLAQLTAIYGLPKAFTLYGGFQESSKYQALALGLGKNMGVIGAFSVDLIQAWSTPKDMEKSSGQSWRMRYSKDFVETGTNFAIAGYRYSTDGYYGMQEVLDSYGNSGALQNRRRNRAELTVNQNLGSGWGALTASAVREDYWNSSKTMESYSLGYNNGWNGISYGLTYTYSKNGSADGYSGNATYDKDQVVAVNVSIPLQRFLSNTWASYSVNSSKNNGTTHNVGLNGTALANNALSWNVQQGYGTDDVGYTGNLNADYKGTYGEVTAGYGYDQDTERLNYGVQGGIVAHENGVTLSQPLGETNVLVKAPGAGGVNILNQTGAGTDFRGYTVVSNISPYRKNDVTLDPLSLPDNVELALTTRTVVPTRGAVVRADYQAMVGSRVLMTLTRADGAPVPFGATVMVADTAVTQSAIVGENGEVYLSGLSDSGTLSVRWGNDPSASCRVNYTLSNATAINGLYRLAGSCH